jgi:hypothetical protein
MYECPLCATVNLEIVKVCDSCGYSFEVNEITDKHKIRAFVMRVSQSLGWAAVIRLEKNINDIQSKKHGQSRPGPSGAWSKGKTATLLGQKKATISEDIRLAEVLDKYPNLLNCNNKSEAHKRLKELVSSITYNGDRPTFDYEKDLQTHLNSHWLEISLFSDWDLQENWDYKDGRYSTGEVGEIDLLARHRKEDRWLVVELKREQSSDETIGQILRYMGWVKEKLTDADGKVEGLIICAAADDRMRYALKCIPFIRVAVYTVENGKIVFKNSEDAYRESTESLSLDQIKEVIEKLQGST